MYEPSEEITVRCNTCSCSSGNWKCTQDKCAGECHIFGTDAVNSFDLLYYPIQTDCDRYVLIDHDEFEISMLLSVDKAMVKDLLSVKYMCLISFTRHTRFNVHAFK